jgi:hypothetical protein
MISAKRIVTIFRQKGGSGEYTKPADELTDKQLAILRGKLGEESPLIASVRSADEWFALTSSHLIWKHAGGMCKIQLVNVEKVVGLIEDPRSFVEGKLHDGKLGVKLRDGSVVNVAADPVDLIWR